MKTPDIIDPNDLAARDLLLMELIRGATRGGAHRNRRR